MAKFFLFYILLLFFSFKQSFALDILDVTAISYEGMPGLAITFDEPIKSNSNYDKYINISDQNGQIIKVKGILDKGLQILYYAPLENNSLYTVAVERGLVGNKSTYEGSFISDVKTISLPKFINFSNPGSIMVNSNRTVLPITASNIDNIVVNIYANNPSNRFFNILLSKLFVKGAADSYRLNLGSNCKIYYNYDDTISISSLLCDSDLVFSKAYNVNSINAQKSLNIEIPDGIFNSNGLYTVVIQTPYDYENFAQTSVIVSDIGLQARDEGDGLVVYARSLSTGNPMSGVKLAVSAFGGYDYYSAYTDISNISNTLNAVTDKNGIAILSKHSLSNNAKRNHNLWTSIFAEKDGMYAYLDVSKSKLDLSDFDLAGKVYSPVNIFIYSSRDLYRAGEEITYNILVRDDKGYFSYGGLLDITLRDPMGKEVDKVRVKIEEYNLYSYKLSDAAKTGNWEISIEYIGNGKYLTTQYFTVSDFIPETMSLTIGDINEPAITDLNVARNLKIKSSYLYGAPVSGNKASGNYRVFPTYSFSGSLASYIFADLELKSTYKYAIQALEDKILNKNGEASWSIDSSVILEPLKKYSYNGPVTIRYYASAYESGGRAITRSKDYTFLPLGEAIGVKPINEKNIYSEDIFFESNQISFDIVNINNKMDIIPAKVSIEIEKVIYNYYWTYSNDKWQSIVNKVIYPVSKSFKELSRHATTVDFNLDNGNYRMIVKNMNTDQSIIISFTVGYYSYYNYTDSVLDNVVPKPDRLAFYFDKSAYKPGDTANILLISPYDGVGRAVLENSNGILWSTDVNTSKGKASLSIPINSNIASSDLYVSAYVVRAEKDLEDLDKSMVLGLSHIEIDRSNRIIPIEIDHPSYIEPDKNYNITIRALDKSIAANAYVTLSYVDSGLLSLKRFNTPDPLKFFFGKILYNVSIYDNFWQVIHKNKYKDAKRYGGDLYTEELNTASARGGDMARSRIKIASHFSKPMKFNSKGEAIVPIRIDDFNGKVHLVATAFSKSNYFLVESDMIVSEDIISTLSTPRFLATGDSSSFALDIANTTDDPLTIKLNIQISSPLKLMGDANITVKIDPHKKDVVSIPVYAVGASGTSNVTIMISSEKYFKEKTWSVDVRSPYPAQTISNLTFINKNGIQHIFSEHIKKYVTSSATLSLAISNNPPIIFPDIFSSLLSYPYGCLEQTISKTLPLLFLSKSILDYYNVKLSIKGAYNDHNIEFITKPLIDHGIKGVLDKMLINGSFGYWDSNSSESYWGTVYAAELLNHASKSGYKVDKDLLEKVNLRLLYYIRNNIYNTNPGYYDFNDADSMGIKAYAAYVLSKYSLISTSDLIAIYDKFITLPNTYMISHLHFSLAFKNIKDRKHSIEAIKVAKEKYKDFFEKKDYHYYSNFYGSYIRDVAWGLSMLLEYNNDYTEYNHYYKGLSEAVSERSWFSTQEKARLLQLLHYFDNEYDFNAAITVSGIKKEHKINGRYEMILRDKDLISDVIVESVNTPLYVSSSFIAYPAEAPYAFMNNSSIERYYYTLENKLIDNLSTINVGDYVLVELRISTNVSVSDGLIVDLIPSGFEIEDQHLDNSYKVENIVSNFNRGHILYEEFRDDRYIASIYNYKGYTKSVWYIMRAVTPGVYSNPNPYFEDMYRFDVKSIGEAMPKTINIIKR